MGDQEHLTARTLDAIGDIATEAWDVCAGTDNPFVRHGFLSACEESGSATAQSGWAARHLVIENDAGELLAAAPLYLKGHSQGEYVFDHGWAAAYERRRALLSQVAMRRALHPGDRATPADPK